MGASKLVYSTIGMISLLDNSRMQSGLFNVEGLFPEDVEQTSLGEAGVMLVTASFSYDILAPELAILA